MRWNSWSRVTDFTCARAILLRRASVMIYAGFVFQTKSLGVTVPGFGAVRVLFLRWPVLRTAVQDGVLTIAELEALPSESRLIASTDYFRQVLQPEDAAVPMTRFVARGRWGRALLFGPRSVSSKGRPSRTSTWTFPDAPPAPP